MIHSARVTVAYMKHIVLYHWSLCACIVIGCVIRVYIGSCVATSQSGYLILYFVRTYVTLVSEVVQNGTGQYNTSGDFSGQF